MKEMKVDANSSSFYDGELSTKEELAELLLDENASKHLNNYVSITAALREENVDESRMAKMRENIFLAIENEEIGSTTTEVKAVAANEPLDLSKKNYLKTKQRDFQIFPGTRCKLQLQLLSLEFVLLLGSGHLIQAQKNLLSKILLLTAQTSI
jgi:negative regulator of sigma E activity